MYHVFIRYQFSKEGRSSYIIARLVINSVILPHTMSIRGNGGNIFAGLFGFWQGSLPAGTYQITVQYRGGNSDTHYTYTNNDYSTRAMDIIYCYWWCGDYYACYCTVFRILIAIAIAIRRQICSLSFILIIMYFGFVLSQHHTECASINLKCLALMLFIALIIMLLLNKLVESQWNIWSEVNWI